MKQLAIIIAFVSCVVFVGPFTWAQGGLDESDYYQKSWAVVIGINEYADFPSLEYAVNDARAISTRFQRMGFEVISVLNEEATKKNILHILQDQLPQQVGKEDRLVVFYAGHGAAGQDSEGVEVGFIIPTDAKSMVDGRRLEIIGGRIEFDEYETFADRANFLSVDEIRNISDVVPAKHVFYILDGCYSGFLDPAVYARSRPSRASEAPGARSSEGARGLVIDAPPSSEVPKSPGTATSQSSSISDYLSVLTSRETVQVLSAGSSGEQVYEKSGHGIFTYYLLRALDGVADLNNDCVVRASELGVFLKQIVPEASGFSQTPLFNRISGEGEFIFIPPICKPIAAIDLQPPKNDKTWSKTEAYKGPKSSRYKDPAYLAVDTEDKLYVLDSKLKKVLKFDSTGKLLSEHFDRAGRDLFGKTWDPHSMTIGYGDNLWVYYAKQGKKNVAGQIMVYDSTGRPIDNWSQTSKPLTACSAENGSMVVFPPKALIALDIEDNLILVDQKDGVMTKCDRNGKLLHQWGRYEKHKVIKEVNKYKTVTDPQGMTVDMFGYIYVSDTKGHGIQKFFDGEWIPSWPNVKGDNPFFFNSPHGIAVDNNLYVYVADTKNHRVKKYTSGGEKLMAHWGKRKAKKGSKYGEFNEPQGVAVNHDSTIIYVADTGNKRVQRFFIKR